MEGAHFQLFERTFLSCHYCSNYELEKNENASKPLPASFPGVSVYVQLE